MTPRPPVPAALLMVVLAVSATGCFDAQRQHREQHEQEEAQALAVCTKAGGFLVRGSWTGQIIDCKVVK